MLLESVSQRADYTFKHNRTLGRHGWLRLTPAYSVKLVQSLLTNVPQSAVVLDPFSGTGTTPLVAAEHGNTAFGFDINPFLIWLGNIKCRSYSPRYLQEVRQKATAATKVSKRILEGENWIPPIHNIERWWSRETLNALASLRTRLVQEFGEPKENLADGLAWVAFCRLAIETSSAAFNHVSMSFHETVEHYDLPYVSELYLSIIDYVLKSCERKLPGAAEILNCDACDAQGFKGTADIVLTSPPYPNRISYIRELRPYMYWTRFLDDARQAGELDWTAIGGTWGVATSRLNSWLPTEKNLPGALRRVADEIAGSDGKNGELLSRYVFKYFHDMHIHFRAVSEKLTPEARINYIVGNSTFYGCLVDTPQLLAQSMDMLGYKDVTSTVIRKRNSNKALFEYNVSGLWPKKRKRK